MKAILAALFVFSFNGWAKQESPVFRLHLLNEPTTLDPQTWASGSGNYIIQNVLRGLTRLDGKKGLVNEGASKCLILKKGSRIECKISKDHRYSNGEAVTAQDYVQVFQRLVSPLRKSPQIELFLSLKNAREIWLGKKPVEKLGVKALDSQTIQFEFDQPDIEFLYKLAHPAVAPRPNDQIPDIAHAADMLSTGPYKFKEWRKKDRIVLEANPYYLHGNPNRPNVEAIFIEEDSTALRLYELKKINFLRRLQSGEIPKYRNRPDFAQFPMARFDYIGFGPALKAYPKLRKALSLSLDFESFVKIFDALGAPGCPSLPRGLYDNSLCLKFDPEEAKKLFKEQGWPETVKRELQFSQMGGEDIARAAEWFQGQWRKNLGLAVELRSQEQGLYLKELHSNPPALFRKGLGLDRPTCLAGLESFAKEGPENFIQLDSPKYFKILDQIRKESDAKKVRKLCDSAIQILIGENWIIPLGEIHFTMLIDPHYQGWSLNSINQLDLSDLHYVQDLKLEKVKASGKSPD